MVFSGLEDDSLKSGSMQMTQAPKKKSQYKQQNHGSKALSKTLFENTGQKVFRNRFTQDPRNPIGSVAGIGGASPTGDPATEALCLKRGPWSAAN